MQTKHLVQFAPTDESQDRKGQNDSSSFVQPSSSRTGSSRLPGLCFVLFLLYRCSWAAPCWQTLWRRRGGHCCEASGFIQVVSCGPSLFHSVALKCMLQKSVTVEEPYCLKISSHYFLNYKLMDSNLGLLYSFVKNLNFPSVSLYWSFTWWYIDNLNCNGIIGKLSFKNGINYFLVYVVFVPVKVMK